MTEAPMYGILIVLGKNFILLTVVAGCCPLLSLDLVDDGTV